MIRAVLVTATLTAALLTGATPTAASAAVNADPAAANAAPAAVKAAAAVGRVAEGKAGAAAAAPAAALTGPVSAPGAVLTGPAGKGKTKLTLAYMAEAGYAAAVVLTCEPPGGPHPHAAHACRTLKKVDGQPSRLKPRHTMCMMIYSPITAQVAGTWRGKKINWSHKYGNSCEMNRANGVLFAF